MLRRLAASPSRALGAKHAVVVGGAGQRGEDLLAVDEEAAVDRLRLGAERDGAGRGRAAFGERLRIDRAALEDALVVHAAAARVRARDRRRSCQVVGERARPQGRADMHVPRQRSRAAVAAELGGGEAIGPEIARRGRHPPSGCRSPAGPRGCMSRKFSIGKVASRSCLAARGASTRAPKRRALAISVGLARRRAGKRRARKIGASVSRMSIGCVHPSHFRARQ